jgi:predicted esterase
VNGRAAKFVIAVTVVLACGFTTEWCDAATPVPAGAATTRPVTAEEARYQAYVGLTELLLDQPGDADLLRIAQGRRFAGDHAAAAVLGLTALRGKPKDSMIEYELACNFALWGQRKLANRYLGLAADHGYWGYRVVTEDTDLAAIKDTPEFAEAAKKIKASFAVQSKKNPPGKTVATPSGNPPAARWPVVVFLHGWASSRHDFDDDAKLLATMGYVGVTLDGTEVMGPNAFMWTRNSVAPTHTQIQDALANLGVKIDAKRVFLQGFSQGAMHAVRLLADHPDAYRGAICNSPGSVQLTPVELKDAASTGALLLSLGSRDLPPCKEAVPKLEALWKSKGRPVKVIGFDGGHQLPPDAERLFRDAMAFLDAPPKAK